MTIADKRYYGLFDAARARFIASLFEPPSSLTVICPDRSSATHLANDLRFFVPESTVVEYPPWDTLPFEPVPPQQFLAAERIHTLWHLAAGKSLIVVTTMSALCQRVLPLALFNRVRFSLSRGDRIEHVDLIRKLDAAGFRRVSLVEDLGEFAVRGGVIDIFPSTSDGPLRLEFLDDVIEKLKLFDCETQRSLSTLNSVSILPVRELYRFGPDPEEQELMHAAISGVKERGKVLETPPREIAKLLSAIRLNLEHPALETTQPLLLPALATYFDFVGDNAKAYVLEDEREVFQALDSFEELIQEREERFTSEHRLIPERSALYLSPLELAEKLSSSPVLSLDEIEFLEGSTAEEQNTVRLRTRPNNELKALVRSGVHSGDAFRALGTELEKWRKEGYRIAFVIGSRSRAERLQRILLDLNFDLQIESDLHGLAWEQRADRYPMVILLGHLTSGAQLLSEKLIYIAEQDIFRERSYRSRTPALLSHKRLLGNLSQLSEGQYVVHVDYGIGIYRGLKHFEIEGTGTDLVTIEYADSTLHLPVHNISKIQKFSAAEGQVPTLDRLSTSKWKKTKKKVEQAVVALAGDLIKLYAARDISRGWSFDPYNAEDERFADGFAYDETLDQRRAIEETLSDMSTEQPMDRLVCGDVGFGKTEVALRASYKCIQNAKQVALLAPTTILVEQHRETFAARFAEFPVRIAALSRFYSAKENREALEKIASGKVDIVIGTHRLLQRDISFRDLGLLIVDEEHRFGVKQKERLKQLKKEVDVLTLTATPIPRTLHMSLLGIRDISIICTPPHDRRAIRTYIAPKDEALIRDSILRETQRGGQSFYVHNRVQSIDLVCAELQELVPEARIDFAHGQMTESDLEKIMLRFLQREIDVLVCTTIIESGLDIPNANTMVVNRADAFGLAQLYQLRGRVGRSSRQAYCYLLIPESRKIGRDAQQRLKALQSLDDLGRGFDLAIRDMEIRGAGNLLGKEQSGNVLAVGFELYTKILKEAVHHLKGEDLSIEEIVDPEVKIDANAFIPEHYIPDISERLILYQRLASLRNREEAQELWDEICDRFGPPGAEVENLLRLMTFRGALKKFGIVKADIGPQKATLAFNQKAPIDSAKLVELVHAEPERFSLSKALGLTLKKLPDTHEQVFRYIETLLSGLQG